MEYDPFTCITAGELRSMGIVIDDGVPDCAWVPRFSLRWTATNIRPLDEEEREIEVTMKVNLTEPFRWINVNVKLQGGN